MLNPLQKIALQRINKHSNHYLILWWVRKYNRPCNDPLLLSLTWEELYIDYIIDHYANDPKELEKAEAELGGKGFVGWEGQTSEQYEAQIKKKLGKVQDVNLSKWQDDTDKGEDEFEEDFTEGSK